MVGPIPFGTHQRLELTLAGPRYEQWLECEQYTAQSRLGPARALRDRRYASGIARKKLDDETRLAKRIAVQDERGLGVVAVGT